MRPYKKIETSFHYHSIYQRNGSGGPAVIHQPPTLRTRRKPHQPRRSTTQLRADAILVYVMAPLPFNACRARTQLPHTSPDVPAVSEQFVTAVCSKIERVLLCSRRQRWQRVPARAISYATSLKYKLPETMAALKVASARLFLDVIGCAQLQTGFCWNTST